VLPDKRVRLGPVVSSVGRTELDLRSAFNDFLEPYSQNVILQRVNLSSHCSHCWNETMSEGNPRCAYCLGRGYSSTFETVKSRRMSALNEHREQLETQSAPGPEIVDEVFWFFEWGVNPQAEDIVYEVSWLDDAQVVPDQLLFAWRSTYSTPFRGSGGRIEFWRMSAKSRPIDRDMIGSHLRLALGQQATYQYLTPTPLVSSAPNTPAAPSGPTPAPPTQGTTALNASQDVVFTQQTPASIWTIEHNLGRYPTVLVIDSGGSQVIGDYSYPDLNTVVLTFSAPFAGQAYLS
jgi:hypothetical protein